MSYRPNISAMNNAQALSVLQKNVAIPDCRLMVGTAENLSSVPILVYAQIDTAQKNAISGDLNSESIDKEQSTNVASIGDAYMDFWSGV